MKTLPSQAATEKDNKKSSVIFLADLTSISGSDLYATKTVTLGSESYAGLISSIGQIGLTSEFLGGLAEMGNAEIVMPNQGFLSNLLSTTPIITNKAVKIYLVFDDGTPLLVAEKVQLFDGIIIDHLINSSNTITFVLRSKEAKDHVEIGTKVGSSNYPTAPDKSIGKVLPIVYGKHEWSTVASSLFFGEPGPIPALLTAAWNTGSMGQADFHLDTVMDSVSRIWGWDSKLSEWVEIDPSDYSVTLNDGGRTRVRLTDSEAICKAYLSPVKNHSEGGFPDTSYDNSGLIVNGSEKTGDIQSVKEGVSTEEANVIMRFPQFGGGTEEDVGVIAANYPILNFLFDVSGGNFSYDKIQLVWQFKSITYKGTFDYVSGNGTDKIISINMSTEHANSGIEWSFGESSLTFVKLQIFVNSVGGGPADGRILALNSREIRMIVKYTTKQLFEKILVEGNGKKYGIWIISRPSHPDDWNIGGLIRNPIGIIEDIIRTYLGYGDSSINIASFNTAATKLSNWKFDFILDKTINSEKLLQDLCELCHAKLWWAYDGKVNIVVFDATDGFSVSGTDTPDPADIYNVSPLSNGDSYSQHPILTSGGEDILNLHLTDQDDLLNDIKIYGGWRHNKRLFSIESTDSDATSKSNYGTYADTMETRYVGDQATLDNIAQFEINMRKSQLNICEFPTGLNAIHLEPSDRINIRHPILDGIYGTASVTKKWEVLDPIVIPSAEESQHANLRVIEVPDIGAPPNA